MIRTLMPLAGAALLASCAGIEPARMALPAELASRPAIPVTGIGGFERGTFAFDGRNGSFRRSDTLFAVGRLFESRGGIVEVTLEEPGAAALAIECRVRERTLNYEFLTFTPSPMALGCTSPVAPLRFELQGERPSLREPFAPQRRGGELRLGDVALEITSVHGFDGSPMRSETPFGYVMASQGVPVAAVELNGRPRAFIAEGVSPAERRAIDAGIVVLSVFWDPADSALGSD